MFDCSCSQESLKFSSCGNRRVNISAAVGVHLKRFDHKLLNEMTDHSTGIMVQVHIKSQTRKNILDPADCKIKFQMWSISMVDRFPHSVLPQVTIVVSSASKGLLDPFTTLSSTQLLFQAREFKRIVRGLWQQRRKSSTQLQFSLLTGSQQILGYELLNLISPSLHTFNTFNSLPSLFWVTKWLKGLWGLATILPRQYVYYSIYQMSHSE